MKIKCITLFDITKTNVGRRGAATREEFEKQRNARNQQINFETILQIISMRAQPENISAPKSVVIQKNDDRWGLQYTSNNKSLTAWEFNFDVYARDVFNDGLHKLGNLYHDSAGVPMIINLDETSSVPSQIVTQGELKNIHYEVIEDDDNEN